MSTLFLLRLHGGIHTILKDKVKKEIVRLKDDKIIRYNQLHLIKNKAAPVEEYCFQKEVPQKFWEILHSQYTLPTDSNLRKRFTSKIFDLKHRYLCHRNKDDFHNHADPLKCKCKTCKQPMDWYHECQPILTNVAS